MDDVFGINRRISNLVYENGISVNEVCERIEKRSSEELKRICPITPDRLKGIMSREKATVLECILLAQLFNKKLSYFIF